MKQSTLTTNKLAIIYFATYLITTIMLSTPDFLQLPHDFYGSMQYIAPAAFVLSSVIMLGVVIADMIKLHRAEPKSSRTAITHRDARPI